MTCILADDSTTQLGIIRQAVMRCGLTVIGEFSNGKDAVDAVRALQPDFLFTDYTMPYLTGGEMAEQLHAAGSRTHVILVTAAGQAGIKQTKGVSSILVKPIGKVLVELAIGRALASRI